MRSARIVLGALLVLVDVGCNEILGLADKSIEKSDAGSSEASDADPGKSANCSRNMDCVGMVTDDGPAICLRPEMRCVELLSPDCTSVSGDYRDDKAIVIASLLSTTGAQAATNIERQQSAVLAVEQINAAGGIPHGSPPVHRPLVLVSCDEVADLTRASEHLIRELRVPAIIGPNTSQDTLDLSNELSAAAGTLLISPTAVASSVADLLDDGLTWSMVPSDVQRAPLMIQQINALEMQLKKERNKQQIKLGVLFRDDALGAGTRSSLNALVLNGKAISDAQNLGSAVKLSPYRVGQSGQAELVAEYVAFAPDIVVLAGTAEAITQLVVPIERAWGDGPRPHYVAIDSVKVPELLEAVERDGDFRLRVRGTGVVPTMASMAVSDAFRLDYLARYPGASAGNAISGMGSSYDATLAVAYAITAMREGPITGANIAQGLRQLSGGPAIELRSTKILAAMQELAGGRAIGGIGTLGALVWDDAGSITAGSIEMWCIGVAGEKALFESSGLSYDVASMQTQGTYIQCAKR
jgi:ABC-type branched-subunit amino acid transport system substrate-binding protein